MDEQHIILGVRPNKLINPIKIGLIFQDIISRFARSNARLSVSIYVRMCVSLCKVDIYVTEGQPPKT